MDKVKLGVTGCCVIGSRHLADRGGVGRTVPRRPAVQGSRSRRDQRPVALAIHRHRHLRVVRHTARASSDGRRAVLAAAEPRLPTWATRKKAAREAISRSRSAIS